MDRTGAAQPAWAADGRPLAGLRIVELASFVAVPLGTMTLAQLGAEVIRIDPPGGAADFRRLPLSRDGHSFYWAGLNKGKRSVVINHRTPEGQRLIRRLATAGGAAGGIVVTNAGHLPGLRYEDVSRLRPDVIYAELRGRTDGRTAVDYTVNASAGFAVVTGPEDHREPVNHVLPAWDASAGLYLATGLLAAERRRARTGVGAHLQLALEDVALATAGNLGLLAEAQLAGAVRERIGNAVYGLYGHAFRTADDRYVMVVVLTSRHWAQLMDICGRREQLRAVAAGLGADFSTDADRYEYRAVIDAVLAPWFLGRTLAQVEDALAPAGFPWARFRHFHDVVHADRPALQANRVFATLTQPGIGTHLAPGSPVIVDSTPRPPLPAPALGADTEAVLGELIGLAQPELDALRERGVLAGARTVDA